MKTKLQCILLFLMFMGLSTISSLADDVAISRVQYKLESVSRDDGLVTFDEKTTEGNLLVILSGHRTGEDDPIIIAGSGWERHLAFMPEAGRAIAIWSKVAAGDASDIAEIDWQKPEWSTRDAWVILQEFTGGENWEFIEAVSVHNTSEATEIAIGPAESPGSDNILAIAATLYRGDVEEPAYVAGDGDEFSKEMEGLIHYEYEEPNNAGQVVHGSTAFIFTQEGDFEWVVESTWTPHRLVVGMLALFSCDPVPTNVSEIAEEYKKSLSIFPNPVQDGILNINLESANNGEAHIYDLMGRIAFTSRLTRGNNSLNVENLQNGIYILKVSTSSDMTTTHRFMIHR
ncbi:MAG: T9SS C-terminal target domain-containing protein [Marinilabiliales bacterium]|nr:MAG: T9SS C-terminal target domain-containing protein [Marinilabiliales bacterium]